MAVVLPTMTHPAGVSFPRYMRHRQRLNAIRERNKITVAQVSKNENSELGRLLWRLEEQRCLRLAEWYKDLLIVRAELQKIDHSKQNAVKKHGTIKKYTLLSNAKEQGLPVRIHPRPQAQIIASKQQLAEMNAKSFSDLIRRHAHLQVTPLNLPPLCKTQRRYKVERV